MQSCCGKHVTCLLSVIGGTTHIHTQSGDWWSCCKPHHSKTDVGGGLGLITGRKETDTKKKKEDVEMDSLPGLFCSSLNDTYTELLSHFHPLTPKHIIHPCSKAHGWHCPLSLPCTQLGNWFHVRPLWKVNRHFCSKKNSWIRLWLDEHSQDTVERGKPITTSQAAFREPRFDPKSSSYRHLSTISRRENYFIRCVLLTWRAGVCCVVHLAFFFSQSNVMVSPVQAVILTTNLVIYW